MIATTPAFCVLFDLSLVYKGAIGQPNGAYEFWMSSSFKPLLTVVIEDDLVEYSSAGFPSNEGLDSVRSQRLQTG